MNRVSRSPLVNETAMYLRAFEDADFRRCHIAGLVWSRRILVGLLGLLGAGWIAVTINYGSLFSLVWMFLFSPAMAIYWVFGSRLSALQAIEHKVGRSDGLAG